MTISPQLLAISNHKAIQKAIQSQYPHSFVASVLTMFPQFRLAKHNLAIMQALTLVKMGHIKRLVIEMPPRHGKTEITSVQFPMWILGQRPDARFVLASYSQSLAVLNSRRGREIMRGSAFQTVAPNVRINEEKGSEKEWETNKNGGVLAVGVGSGLTGRGADYIIVDDPIKDAEEAQSAVTLENVWQWYTTVVRTRLQPGGAIVFVMTRWNENDLVGRVLRHAERSEHAEPIYRLRLPALAEPDDPLGREEGEALWPESYPVEVLRDVQSLDPHNFDALFQQNPSSKETVQFNTELITFKDVRYKQMVRSWDMAVTENETSDYAVGALVSGEDVEGITPEARKVILESGLPMPYLVHVHDLVRQQAAFPAQRKMVVKTALQDGRGVPIVIEKTRMDLPAFQQLKHDLEELGFDVNPNKPKGDKVARKGALQTICAGGWLSFSPADWNDRAIDEFKYFPTFDHDDIVDAVEQAHKFLYQYTDFDKDWVDAYFTNKN